MERLGRLLFSLSPKQINSIPLVRKPKSSKCTVSCDRTCCFSNTCSFCVQSVLNKDTVEQVLLGQSQWEDGEVGRLCVAQCLDQRLLTQQTRSLVRGLVEAPSRRAKGWTRGFSVVVPAVVCIRLFIPSSVFPESTGCI